MNEKDIQKKLGIPPGATLTALVALAEKVSPAAPDEAFDLLWLSLPWLRPAGSVDDVRHGTPKNVHPFAETGGDLHHFGFLMDGDVPTDDRPIVYVDPKDDDDATQIVAASLRDFLGLVAVAFAEVVSRSATDADWLGFREEWYGDDPARLKEMARLSDLLCTIPGVERPVSPSKVANAYPDQVFKLVFDDENEEDDDGPELVRTPDFKNVLADAERASVFAQKALTDGRLPEAEHHARCGMQHPATRARCLYVLAKAQHRAGQKGSAKDTAEELLKAWLDPSPIALPGVHAQKAIDRTELIALLELVEGSHAAPLIKQVKEAPELVEPSGDFM